MKENLRLIGIAILAGLCVFPALAQNAGETIYTQKCAVCHGPDGRANTQVGKILKAQDYHAPAIIKAPDAQLIAAVKKGKGKMPAFGTKLSDAQIKEVIAYVRTLEKKQ